LADVADGHGQVFTHRVHGKQQAAVIASCYNDFLGKIPDRDRLSHFGSISGFTTQLLHDMTDQPEHDPCAHQHRHEHQRQGEHQHAMAKSSHLRSSFIDRFVFDLDVVLQLYPDFSPYWCLFLTDCLDGCGRIGSRKRHNLGLDRNLLLTQGSNIFQHLQVFRVGFRQQQCLLIRVLELAACFIKLFCCRFIVWIHHNIAHGLANLQAMGIQIGRAS